MIGPQEGEGRKSRPEPGTGGNRRGTHRGERIEQRRKGAPSRRGAVGQGRERTGTGRQVAPRRDLDRPGLGPQRQSTKRPPRPALPEERPRLPSQVYRDLKAAALPNELTDVTRAFAAAGEALAEGDVDRATELLTWAKSVATRSAVVREALGVARYLAGDFAGAYRELLAYRRLSGRSDQNHLLADCARAAGRPDKVIEYVDEMAKAGVATDRVVEGLIVLAGDRSDRGDLRGALAALERAGLDPDRIQPWHPRLWYLSGDLWQRLGDLERARDYFEAITAVTDDFLDAEERLAALAPLEPNPDQP